VRGARANAFEESGADGADGGGTNRARTKITARLLVPTTPKVKDAPREAQPVRAANRNNFYTCTTTIAHFR